MKDNIKSGYTFLTNLLQGLDTDCLEQSIKISKGRISDNRFLTGIAINKLEISARDNLFKELAVPDKGQEILKSYYDRASSILFGYESPEPGQVILKVYLEFWDYVLEKVSVNPEASQPELMHLGIKWDPAKPADFFITRYHCHSLYSLRNIQKWIQNKMKTNSGIISEKVLNIVGQRSGDRGYVFLEATEDDNDRSSIDINLYKAELMVCDIRFPILDYLKICDLSQADTIIEQYGKYPLGHISAGTSRNKDDFFTIYFEIE